MDKIFSIDTEKIFIENLFVKWLLCLFTQFHENEEVMELFFDDLFLKGISVAYKFIYAIIKLNSNKINEIRNLSEMNVLFNNPKISREYLVYFLNVKKYNNIDEKIVLNNRNVMMPFIYDSIIKKARNYISTDLADSKDKDDIPKREFSVLQTNEQIIRDYNYFFDGLNKNNNKVSISKEIARIYRSKSFNFSPTLKIEDGLSSPNEKKFDSLLVERPGRSQEKTKRRCKRNQTI